MEPASPRGAKADEALLSRDGVVSGNDALTSYSLGELLTQSMWNTVSLEVQISEKVGGKRNLRLSTSLSFFCPTLILTAHSTAHGSGCVVSHNRLSLMSLLDPVGSLGGIVANLTLIWRSRFPAALSIYSSQESWC